MAIDQSFIPIGETGEKLDSVRVDTPAGQNLHRETVVIADPETPDALVRVRQILSQLTMTDWAVAVQAVIHGRTSQGNIVDIKANPSGALAVDASGSTFTDANQSGAWSYLAGITGSVTVAANRRVLQISATAGDTMATMTINGGQTITIPPYRSLTIEPKGNLVAPTVAFSGTTAYFIEAVL